MFMPHWLRSDHALRIQRFKSTFSHIIAKLSRAEFEFLYKQSAALKNQNFQILNFKKIQCAETNNFKYKCSIAIRSLFRKKSSLK